MKIFCNEWDEYAAQWIRNLSNAGEIPDCDVSEKSITDLTADDLNGYDQCHFFAGIAGWPLALKWAGLSDTKGIWTGSPPCQPFSLAGKKLGKDDERHLAPVWIRLIREKRPSIIFGEQVASAISHKWIDELKDNLEAEGYAFGFSVLTGDVIGAPHERKRIFFGAIKMDNASEMYAEWNNYKLLNKQEGERQKGREAGPSDFGSSFEGWENNEIHTSQHDSKNRICKPGIPLLVNGVSTAMGRISAYGNAIIPGVGTFFIDNFMEAVGDMIND